MVIIILDADHEYYGLEKGFRREGVDWDGMGMTRRWQYKMGKRTGDGRWPR
jgi:hypothetical protein